MSQTLRMVSAELEAMIDAKVKRAVADATRVDEFLSTDKAAKVADVHPDTIRRWVRERKLTGHKAGSRIRVSRLELERFLRTGGASNDELSPEELAAKAFG